MRRGAEAGPAAGHRVQRPGTTQRDVMGGRNDERLHSVHLSGRARAGGGEAIRNIYYSYRQLPPGHDPGADPGEPPTGRQRGSRPLDILVECRGHHRPRRDEPSSRDGHHNHVRFAPDEPESPRRASRAGRVVTQTIRAVTAITALPAGTRRRWSRQSWAHRVSVKNGKSHSDHGRHRGHDGGHGANGGPVPTVRA
jgi:hypothetical protein